MIYIKVNRWTIMKLEEALEKYNKRKSYTIHEYESMINKLLELYLAKDEKIRKRTNRIDLIE